MKLEQPIEIVGQPAQKDYKDGDTMLVQNFRDPLPQPPLEQLIEACVGAGLFTLMQMVDNTEYEWCATLLTKDQHYSYYGKTPTDATRLLYDYLKEINLL